MTFEALEQYLEEEGKRKYALLGARQGEWDAALADCTEAQRRIMQYYLTCLTACERAELDFALLKRFAVHAARMREQMPWTRALAEEDFLAFVAAYRINAEAIVEHRERFCQMLLPYVEGKTAAQAALAVNLWCGCTAGYRMTDGRDASPLCVYGSTYARCGEEAAYLVAALRSVGLPARTITSMWPMRDDGHVFAEVLLEDGWHFMGGCEPEGILDRGWFNEAAAQAMMAQTTGFSLVGAPEFHYQAGGMTFGSHLSHYAKVKIVAARVVDAEGRPVPDALVRVEEFNSGGFIPLAILRSDENGEARWPVGFGTVKLSAWSAQGMAEVFLDAEETSATLRLAAFAPEEGWQIVCMRVPGGKTPYTSEATAAQKKAVFGDTDPGKACEARRQGFGDADLAAAFPALAERLSWAGENVGVLREFLTADDEPLRAALVATLNEKDLADIGMPVLEDMLHGAMAVREGLEEEDFLRYVLPPRVATEELTAHRRYVQNFFTPEQQEAFRADPRLLEQWVLEHCAMEAEDAAGLIPSVPCALQTGLCPLEARPVLLTQLCRALGIPAALDRSRGQVLCKMNGEYLILMPEGPAAAVLLIAPPRPEMEFMNGWSLFIRRKDDWRLVPQWHVPPRKGAYRCRVPAGDYRLLTWRRLTDGSAQVAQCSLRLGEGEKRIVRLPDLEKEEG